MADRLSATHLNSTQPTAATSAARPLVPIISIDELEADPHGLFRRHRPLTPIVAHEAGGHLVLRAKDVERLAKDIRLRATETELPRLRGIVDGPLLETFENSMLTSNGVVHRRRRAPFTRAFAARLIAEMRPHIRQTAETLIDAFYEDGTTDLVGGYTALLPARTISDLLGLPHADIPHFTQLVYEVSRVFSFTFTADEIPALQAAAQKLADYVQGTLEDRRRRPRDDFLSAVLAATDQNDELSSLEVIVQIVTLIVGGTDTTRVAGAMQASLLLQHPAQWDAVCSEPTLVPAAVSEALRYEPSVASLARFVLEDVDLDGYTLPADTFVRLSTMSAMRDERIYDNPDVFDISRNVEMRGHLVFGGGPHRCIGEALARIELEEGLAALTQRIPQLRLAGDAPRPRGHVGIRRIGRMPVAWRL
ncbi:MAG TPA: cytochrome P450 [Dongiaceae bacterium]|nr:cytochrome P450 [Dongiaceae bacterium]